MDSATTADTLKLLHKYQDTVLITRYLTLIGIVLLVHDHMLSFRDEVKLIWRAPPSFGKYAFLINRYLVLGCQLAVTIEQSGLTGVRWSNASCQQFLFTLSMFALCSIGLANFLVLIRVCLLWEGNKIVTRTLTSGYLLAFCVQFGVLFAALVRIVPSVAWSSNFGMCIVLQSNILLPVAWSIPMFFELLILVSTCLNALSRPRPAHEKLAHALQRDGIVYFVALSCLRGLNLTLAATLNPAYALLAAFFVWAMVTVTLNRSLLSLRRAEAAVAEGDFYPLPPRAMTPFAEGAISVALPGLHGRAPSRAGLVPSALGHVPTFSKETDTDSIYAPEVVPETVSQGHSRGGSTSKGSREIIIDPRW